VTWGVFTGREIIQPTVVDPISFMIWKVINYLLVSNDDFYSYLLRMKLSVYGWNVGENYTILALIHIP
jgi:hypothetical protein